MTVLFWDPGYKKRITKRLKIKWVFQGWIKHSVHMVCMPVFSSEDYTLFILNSFAIPRYRGIVQTLWYETSWYVVCWVILLYINDFILHYPSIMYGNDPNDQQYYFKHFAYVWKCLSIKLGECFWLGFISCCFSVYALPSVVVLCNLLVNVNVIYLRKCDEQISG